MRRQVLQRRVHQRETADRDHHHQDAAQIVGAVVKDPVQDRIVLQEYLESVVRERSGWRDLYDAVREVL